MITQPINIRRAGGIFVAVILACTLSCGKKKDAAVDPVKAGKFASGETMRVPLIAWGADIVTIYANGSSAKTIKDSLFDREGLNIELFREDDFNKQTNQFIRGEIAYLRGTMGMINTVMDRLNSNDDTRPVIVYQHSWSAGGDALVVKEGIKSVTDLRGKTVAIQKNGPHVDYFLKLLKDGGISTGDVRIVWTRDLLGVKGDTPMAKLYGKDVDAAFVIIPDALALTSNGTVGTGAEDSVKGARILLSTKTANRIISDVYAVRKDYFDSSRNKVKGFVKALLQAEEKVKDLFRDKGSAEYRKLLSMGGKLLLDDQNAAEDVKGMYHDAEMAGFNGNVKFFADSNYPRNYKRLSHEIQDSLVALGLLKERSEMIAAEWDYDDLKKGLKYATDVETSRFDPDIAKIIAEKYSKSDSSLFMFEIYFKPNQNSFSVSDYQEEFDKVIDYSSTYGGALITVEGHSDPMGYLRKKKEGADPLLLKKIQQAAKNLSYSRADSVRNSIMKYASTKGVTLDANQINIIGHGINAPRYKIPKTKEEWRKNMRVQFKIIQVEAEENVFKPL